jgi:hypothetical protein
LGGAGGRDPQLGLAPLHGELSLVAEPSNPSLPYPRFVAVQPASVPSCSVEVLQSASEPDFSVIEPMEPTGHLCPSLPHPRSLTMITRKTHVRKNLGAGEGPPLTELKLHQIP